MSQDDDLTPAEFASLQMLAKGPLATKVPHEHVVKLTMLGLIVMRRMEIEVTEDGQKRLRSGP